MSRQLAQRTRGVMPSAVREILKVAEQPDVLSFAGGLPAPELFPVKAIADAHARVLARAGPAALQYSTTEGFGPLREWVAEGYRRRGVSVTADEVLITNGSQQGIDLVTRVLVDPGAVVVTENPTYLAALQVFQAAQATVVAVDSDREGMVVESLAKALATHDVRLIYVVPNFANPTGATLSATRRLALMALAKSWNVPVLEDDPYAALSFDGAVAPPLTSMDDAGLVVSLGTFSKTLAPGLRVGWLLAREAVRRHLVVARQAADLHSNTLAQRAVVELFETFDLEAHLATLRAVYRERCIAMARAVERHFPKGTRFSLPDGGLFLWVDLPAGLDAVALLEQAATVHRVAYVPGAPFFVGAPRPSTLRLNFSNCRPEAISDGISRLGRLFKEAHAAPRQPEQSS
jgi:2-aminoadipate transaminase